MSDVSSPGLPSRVNPPAEGTTALALSPVESIVWAHEPINTDPPRAITYKQKTKVAGFGGVPPGSARTVIHLIVPPRDHTDLGLDRELILDFNPDPPVFQIFNALNTVTLSFPSITVEGNLVTLTSTLIGETTPFKVEDVNTLRLKRTKP